MKRDEQSAYILTLDLTQIEYFKTFEMKRVAEERFLKDFKALLRLQDATDEASLGGFCADSCRQNIADVYGDESEDQRAVSKLFFFFKKM